jgi:hypothetical protein
MAERRCLKETSPRGPTEDFAMRTLHRASRLCGAGPLKRRRWVTLSCLCAVVLWTACGMTEHQTASATGVWSGGYPNLGAQRGLRLTLKEASDGVSGSGEDWLYGSGWGTPIIKPYAVAGTHDDPTIALTLSSPGFAPLSVQGTFTDANTISARLIGAPERTAVSVVLHRR